LPFSETADGSAVHTLGTGASSEIVSEFKQMEQMCVQIRC